MKVTTEADRPAQAFDLNIEKVLEHWTVPFAIRELIANALDEQALTGTADPEIYKDGAGCWHIRDAGRGLRYEHLTQNENAEKRKHSQVIGQFGMGLKDALAVFDRRGVSVMIRSPHATITTGRRPKEGFPDVVTLHALVSQPSDPGQVGTDITLTGVKDTDVETARRFFLRYSDEKLLEATEYGDVLARSDSRQPARIYVKGLLVAGEPNFLFSYNITKLSAPLRRALNRERSNVGRGAYSDRVKTILTACRSTAVAGPLAEDLNGYAAGRLHDELAWRDVALHTCRVLQTNEKGIFVTPWQMAAATAQMRYAQDDGYRIVVVPDDIARSLGSLTDLNGKPLAGRPRTLPRRMERQLLLHLRRPRCDDLSRASRIRANPRNRRPGQHQSDRSQASGAHLRDHAAQRGWRPGAGSVGRRRTANRDPPRPAQRTCQVRRHTAARDRSHDQRDPGRDAGL